MRNLPTWGWTQDGAVEAVARAVGAEERSWSRRAVERSLSRLVKWEARVGAQLIASLDGSRASVPRRKS